MSALLPELFLERAREHPDEPAVLAGRTATTYRQLEERARRIARALAARGIGAESIVAVLVPPGPDLVAALLGVWLAGGCYLPLDPLAPPLHLRRIVAASGAGMVLADGLDPALDTELPPDVMVARVERLAEGAPASDAQPGSGLGLQTRPGQAAYMIFTSGSTGTPKGVVVEHAAIANRVQWGVRALKLTAADRILQKTPLTFDAAGWEIFAPLVCGGAVVFGRPDAGRDAGELIASIREQQASVVQVVPTLLRLLAAEPDLGLCTSLRLLCSAGEALHAELCQRVLARLDVEIWNTYGPTECAIDFTAARFDPAQHSGPVPIGRPIDGMDCLLLEPVGGGDGDLRELYARGIGVGRGYHADPAQTAERFLPDPVGAFGARMYRTGDLARVLPDGALEFAGRVDDQIKINGVRVEPGAVEAALETHPAVVAAAVRAVTDPHGVQRLAAWVAVSPADAADGLPAYLRDRLPPTLVPSVVTPVDALPRTTSGKTDHSRLPDPDWAGTDPAAAPPAPEPTAAVLSVEERIVLAAWRRVLAPVPADGIGLDEDFFRLGGHSLMMTRLAAILAEDSGLGLDFRGLHYATTVREQARLLSQAAAARPIRRLPTGARLPLSFAQERFWVQDRMNPGSREYLLPVFVWLPADVPAETVEWALSALMARHDVLRTRFAMDGHGLHAVVEPAVPVPLRTVAASAPETGKIVAGELADGFDLGTAPLFRATLVREGGPEQLLVLVCHHIIGDGWSSRLLDVELRELVAARSEQRAARLPHLPLRYVDAAAWQREQLTEDQLAEQLAYWRETLAGLPPLDLPTRRPRDAERSMDGASVPVEVSAEVVAALLEAGRRARATPFVTLLTLWTVLLARAGGQWDFGVGTPHAGRSRPELHDLAGLFINVVVVRARLHPELTFAEALARVAHACRDGFARHAAPFEAVVDAVDAPRDPSRTPLYQALFTVAGDGLVGQSPRERDLELLGQAWQVARTDLAVNLWPDSGGGYGGAIEYATRLFDEAAAAALARDLRALAVRFAADPETPIGAADEPERPGHEAVVLGFIRELLKTDEVGPEDDVMVCGGNSLMAARLLWNIQNAFGVEVSMRAFFDEPTAAGLAREVERLVREQLAGEPADQPQAGF